eukprot:Rmarinus@m.12814
MKTYQHVPTRFNTYPLTDNTFTPLGTRVNTSKPVLTRITFVAHTYHTCITPVPTRTTHIGTHVNSANTYHHGRTRISTYTPVGTPVNKSHTYLTYQHNVSSEGGVTETFDK